ncbi:hypothetical protein VTJ49DRAFT_3976 [Mycothermus thermophilus]|uniref:Uncharacterized protein n=1 Tax=Humicola insolens TaxID=85995 RepID=A0ABR3V8D2_HUMIN
MAFTGGAKEGYSGRVCMNTAIGMLGFLFASLSEGLYVTSSSQYPTGCCPCHRLSAMERKHWMHELQNTLPTSGSAVTANPSALIYLSLKARSWPVGESV